MHVISRAGVEGFLDGSDYSYLITRWSFPLTKRVLRMRKLLTLLVVLFSVRCYATDLPIPGYNTDYLRVCMNDEDFWIDSNHHPATPIGMMQANNATLGRKSLADNAVHGLFNTIRNGSPDTLIGGYRSSVFVVANHGSQTSEHDDVGYGPSGLAAGRLRHVG
jgi:hypothetical protein